MSRHIDEPRPANLSTGPEGLLFTGDLIRSLAPEDIVALGQLANRTFGVEMRSIQSIKADLGDAALSGAEEEPEPPVPAMKDDFRRFAAEHGYPDKRGCMAWNSLEYSSIASFQTNSPYPPLRWIRKNDTLDPIRSCSRADNTVDLRSVRERLTASKMKEEAWVKASTKQIQFLAHLVNEALQPEVPMPTSRAEWVKLYGRA